MKYEMQYKQQFTSMIFFCSLFGYFGMLFEGMKCNNNLFSKSLRIGYFKHPRNPLL